MSEYGVGQYGSATYGSEPLGQPGDDVVDIPLTGVLQDHLLVLGDTVEFILDPCDVTFHRGSYAPVIDIRTVYTPTVPIAAVYSPSIPNTVFHTPNIANTVVYSPNIPIAADRAELIALDGSC